VGRRVKRAATKVKVNEQCITLNITMEELTAARLKQIHNEDTYSVHVDESMNGFLFTSLLTHLMITKRIANGQLSCYQMFRTALQYISEKHLITTGAAMPLSPSPPTIVADAERLAPFTRIFDVTLLDTSGALNLMSRVSRASFDELAHEATLTLSYLDDERNTDPFDATFMLPTRFSNKFDFYIRVPFYANKCKNVMNGISLLGVISY
jgi:hypothetical protein